MSNVYFVRMREMLDGYYDAYRDFFRLAELAFGSDRILWLNEVDPASDNTYILSPLNGSWNNGWQDVKARLILWDLEWRLSEGGHTWDKNELVIPPGVSEVWTSDRWYAGIVGAKYVPLGSHPGLVEDSAPSAEHYDVAPLSCNSQDGGRQHMMDLLAKAGVSIAPNAWNPQRDAILKNTTAMLQVHQWRNIRTIAPLRVAIAAAYGLPLICEQVMERGMFDGVALFTSYDTMPEYVATLTKRYPERLAEHGQALKELLTGEYSFRKCVEAAL
jgi:hypothetical protein